MRVNEKKLRQRGEDGSYMYFPELARIQPSGPTSRLWFFRSEILSWIERVESEAKQKVRQQNAVTVDRAIAPETIAHLKRKGYLGTLKVLGVKV